MKKRRFLQNALLLTVTSIILRAVSTLFSVYISNKIGAEGMGLFQLTFSVYLLAITLSTSGISIAVTRIVSEQLALKNTRTAKSAFHKCFFISIVLGVIAGSLLFFNAYFLGITLLNDTRTILSLQILSFSLPFLSSGAVIRGYFLGLNNPLKSVSTDVAEQLSMIIVTIPILTFFLPKGLEYACCGLVVGSVLSEIISCIYSIILYLTDKTKVEGTLQKGITKQIFSIAAPLAIGYYVRSILTSLENILIPKGLKQFGASSKDALSQYGMIKGMVMPILFFPSAILSGFSSLLMPEVASAKALNNQKRINYIINKCFKATLIFALLVAGLFFCYANEIGMAFYKSQTVGKMLFILTPLVPLMYLDSIVDSILKGLNQQLSSMKYNTADSFLRVLIIYFLVPLLGVKGYIIMLFAGTIFNASLSINRLIVVSKVKFKLVEWLILPCIAITISCVFTKIVFHCPVLINIIISTILYYFILRIIGCITKQDTHFIIKALFSKEKAEKN